MRPLKYLLGAILVAAIVTAGVFAVAAVAIVAVLVLAVRWIMHRVRGGASARRGTRGPAAGSMRPSHGAEVIDVTTTEVHEDDAPSERPRQLD